MIKAVLFDLDDTLLWDERSIREAFAATCKLAEDEYGLDPIKLEMAVRREAANLYESFEAYPFTKQIGINPYEALWAQFTEGEHASFRKLQQFAPYYRKEAWTRGLQSLGIHNASYGEMLAEQFPVERRNRPIVYEETFQILNELRQKHEILLLTNGSPDLQKSKLAGVPELTPYFEHIVISGQFGEGKPAASIFKHAMKLLNIDASEGIMVGDKLTTDMIGAIGVGMKAVWINRDGKPRSDTIIPDYEIRNLLELHEIITNLG
jgi:putative hydrolase of the HAD superfamily